MGLALGIALAAAARIGSAPKTAAAELRRPIIAVALASGAAALTCGFAGASLVAAGSVGAPGGWGQVIPREKHVAFTAAAWAHAASYGSGAIGGAILVAWTIGRRLRSRAEV